MQQLNTFLFSGTSSQEYSGAVIVTSFLFDIVNKVLLRVWKIIVAQNTIYYLKNKKNLSRPEIFATEKCADEAFWGLKSIAGMHEQLWSVVIQFRTRCQKVWKPTLAHTSVAVWHIREILLKFDWIRPSTDFLLHE